jgi:hypothetical protein
VEPHAKQMVQILKQIQAAGSHGLNSEQKIKTKKTLEEIIEATQRRGKWHAE